MLGVIVGGIGNGKTLLLTYLSLLHHLTGYRIVSDYDLNIPHFRINNLEDINNILTEYGKYTLSMMAFDEGWIFIDSRLSTTKKNIVWSRFMMQTRKVGFDVYITLQNIGQIDTRIRSVVDKIFLPQNCVYSLWALAEAYNKDMGTFTGQETISIYLEKESDKKWRIVKFYRKK